MSEMSGEFARIFTLSEARTLLPELQAHFARFAQARGATTRTVEELEELERQRTRANTLELARPLRMLRETLGAHAEEMRESLRMVQDLGVVIKRLDTILIDFPSIRADRVIFLCWQEGEETITSWHEVADGFAGRRPL
ncbi:MAG: DUF2203 domain-containing protein [Chloroflexota bacterium]